MTPLIIAITSTYVILICTFIIGFFRIKASKLNNSSPVNTFSVIIPFRNEETNLAILLNSISQLKYPKELFEVLLINDNSNDNYREIIDDFINNNNLKIRLINNIRKSNAPKKDAIETGIENSNFDWIVTTDADCVLPKFWLDSYDNFIQKKDVVFISGLVTFKTNRTFLDKFQLLDFTALIGCTIGGFGIKKPFMCNGANLCYQKNAFYSVNGFEGNNTIASGDDIFLLEKMILKYPTKIEYLKSIENLVTTSTMPSLKSLISQRIRWASKTTSYSNNFAKLVSLIVLLMNILCAIVITNGIYSLSLNNIAILILSLKFIVDLFIITVTLKLTKKTREIIYYPIIFITHPFFNMLIALISIFKKRFHWKNRSY